jgi:hypothetical protein
MAGSVAFWEGCAVVPVEVTVGFTIPAWKVRLAFGAWVVVATWLRLGGSTGVNDGGGVEGGEVGFAADDDPEFDVFVATADGVLVVPEVEVCMPPPVLVTTEDGRTGAGVGVAGEEVGAVGFVRGGMGLDADAVLPLLGGVPEEDGLASSNSPSWPL